MSADWYYVGHFGQLGPLTFEQMSDLASDGVIENDTYVWKTGMVDWVQAVDAPDLTGLFPKLASPPPPPPSAAVSQRQRTAEADQTRGYGPAQASYPVASRYQHGGQQQYGLHLPVSDKNRATAAILNLIPGIGRFYLGYSAHGLLQFMTSFCGVGIIWSWIDAVYILAGGVKLDGYGRKIQD